MILKDQENKKVYSDGEEIEAKMLRIAEQYPEDAAQDYISQDSSYTLNNTFSSVRQNILNWYPFKHHSDILEIGAGMGSLTGLLCDKAENVVSIEMSEARARVIRARYPQRENLTVISQDINSWETEQKFDYIVFIGVLEYAAVFSENADPYVQFLQSVKRLLRKNGKVLFAIENKFGLKYWLGGSEDHLQEPFAGIAGYKEPGTPKTFSRIELENMLRTVGLRFFRFYSVLPDYKFPELIYSDDYKPDYMNLKKVNFTYSRNSALIADERDLYKDIIENNVFPFFANSFLVEASCDELDNRYITHVSAKGEVYKEFRVSTLIDNMGSVYKVPMHENAVVHTKNILENTEYLSKRGLNILPVTMEGNVIKSPKLQAVGAQNKFVEALSKNDMSTLLLMADKLKESLFKSSVFIPYNINNIIVKNGLAGAEQNFGIILQKAFVDMTFYNAFWKDDELIFYDQEWCFERVPLNFCMYYSLKSAFQKADVKTSIALEDLLAHYEISNDHAAVYDKLEDYIWSRILYRQTDLYGEDGYCNRFDENSLLRNNIKSIQDQVSQLESLLEQERDITAQKTEENQKLAEMLECQAQNISELKGLLNQCHENQKELEQIIRNKEGHIELLLQVEREYEREKRSKTYRMALLFRKISLTILPLESKRRFLAGIFVKIIKKPRLMLHVINPRRIRNFFVIAKKEGMKGVRYHYKLVEEVENSRLNPFEANKFQVQPINEADSKKIEDYENLFFTEYEEPIVSIIIPVYNQFGYTYNCLSSILSQSGDIKYEVIVADDCSTDLTSELHKAAEGLTIIHNQKNLRFLLNCNHAAETARGKYLVFLNNDTQVQENWLQPMINLLEKDDSIGMTGAKLVYSDGWLQEAGGIFWNDGSAWNYGKRENPDDPEFNYVKETDYISGAAIMIRRSLWNEIGGFDKRYSPAYYEDADLAFEVRRHGYKVVYQPLSVVVHFEGISNGTDLTTGQKAYQVENQKKFYEKWKEILQKENFPNGENVFMAKDRSRFKKQILVVDHYVPHFDKDAGGKCTYMYLLLFVKMGFKVTFIGDNFYRHEPYTTDLNQHGIEVLYGNYYFNNWQDWLKENLHYFDYVYLQRPHIAIKYIDLVKQYSHAKVLYFAHDLHHVREYREYLLTMDEEKLKSSEHWKDIEYELFQKADVGHVVGTYEQELMQKAFPDKPIRNIPLYIYEDVPDDINKNFQERNDLIYVGGFGHPPNVDAVLWFGREVFPKVLKKNPEMKWHVVGGKVPLEIQQLASENILIEGFLSDEELHRLYKTCRMAVVPLRVGAGVKGKVVEAAYYQIPLVTTTTGAEGLSMEEGNMVVEDDADTMASLICNLYDDYNKLNEMSEAGREFIGKYFTEKQALRVLRLDVNN